MKHLRRFFESVGITKDDILDNFQYITDKLGEPNVYESKFGEAKKWILVWDLGLNVTHIQEAHTLINKLKSIVEEIDDVISASERLPDWNFNMSLSTELRIEMIPKETGKEEYEFIRKYDSRTLYVIKSEIERFFTSRGSIVAKWDVDSSYNEYNESNDLEITLSKPNPAATSELSVLVRRELVQKQDSIDRQYQLAHGPSSFAIRSYEEKSYIDLV